MPVPPASLASLAPIINPDALRDEYHLWLAETIIARTPQGAASNAEFTMVLWNLALLECVDTSTWAKPQSFGLA